MEVREFCWVNGMLAKLKQNKVEGKCRDTFELYLTSRKIHTVRGVVKRGASPRLLGAGSSSRSSLGLHGCCEHDGLELSDQGPLFLSCVRGLSGKVPEHLAGLHMQPACVLENDGG